MTVSTITLERDRTKIPDQYKWNLNDIYADVAAWRRVKEGMAGRFPALRSYQGRLGSAPGILADALEAMFAIDKELSRLHIYASLLSDEDRRVSAPLGMQQEMEQLEAGFSAQVAFLKPEILELGVAAIETALAAEPRLRPYAFFLRDIVRRAAHTLSDEEEKILAAAGPLAASTSNVYTILANADFEYPTITLTDGSVAKVDQPGYVELRARPERGDRRRAMSVFFEALGCFSRTYGATLNASVQKAWFYAQARKYGSSLEASLDGPNIPVSVYMRLVEGVNKSLPTFHRYLRLRKRMLALSDQLHYYDLYAPLVASVALTYSPEEAQERMLASMAPLGSDYVNVVRRSFAERWIDFFPSTGKRAGAYSEGDIYDVHPYILLNYLGQYNDVSTLAHELGHTMQSYYSNRTQPYPTAHYPTFVAEVASTFNEALLIDYMLRHTDDRPTRMSLLGSSLENIKATVFRQTQFAEFELRMHEMAQRGEALTGESLVGLYLGITRKYYGHDRGICIVDDYVGHEWSNIPHFYNEFYVFQYATSFAASQALAKKVLSGDQTAAHRYLTFLAAGGSKYPIDLLAEAGVDMTSDEPLHLTVQTMDQRMDEMEVLMEQSGWTRN
jgi:oligoendopeptidase F